MYQQGTWVKDPELAQASYEEAKKIVPLLRMHVLETEPHKMMPFFYNAADALLITSRHEGSNNSVKEALACGLPIVATACGDIAERLQGVSWSYVCSRDATQLGMRLADVVTARERTNGRQHILDLSSDRVASNVIGCYEKALASEYSNQQQSI
jgi:glycosyltransferase involved in cell wall biosynthesis